MLVFAGPIVTQEDEVRAELLLHRQRAGRGFTIVEVLVAMTVTGVGLLAVFTALRMAHSTAGLISDEQQAQQLAQRHMTSLLVEPIQRMGVQTGQTGRFSWQHAIRRTKDPDLAEVVVSVRWAHQGQQRKFQLVSLRPLATNP